MNRAQLQREIRAENRRFLAQLLIGAAALLATGVAIGRFWPFHS